MSLCRERPLHHLWYGGCLTFWCWRSAAIRSLGSFGVTTGVGLSSSSLQRDGIFLFLRVRPHRGVLISVIQNLATAADASRLSLKTLVSHIRDAHNRARHVHSMELDVDFGRSALDAYHVSSCTCQSFAPSCAQDNHLGKVHLGFCEVKRSAHVSSCARIDQQVKWPQ